MNAETNEQLMAKVDFIKVTADRFETRVYHDPLELAKMISKLCDVMVAVLQFNKQPNVVYYSDKDQDERW